MSEFMECSPEIKARLWVAAVREVLAERGPDFVYTSPRLDGVCQYFDKNGAPSCLFGAVAVKLGVTNFLREGAIIRFLMWDLGILDSRVCHASARAQMYQDQERPYSVVSAAFETALVGGFLV